MLVKSLPGKVHHSWNVKTPPLSNHVWYLYLPAFHVQHINLDPGPHKWDFIIDKVAGDEALNFFNSINPLMRHSLKVFKGLTLLIRTAP